VNDETYKNNKMKWIIALLKLNSRKNYFFPFGSKKYLPVRSKSTWVKDRSTPYLLQVKRMFKSGQVGLGPISRWKEIISFRLFVRWKKSRRKINECYKIFDVLISYSIIANKTRLLFIICQPFNLKFGKVSIWNPNFSFSP